MYFPTNGADALCSCATTAFRKELVEEGTDETTINELIHRFGINIRSLVTDDVDMLNYFNAQNGIGSKPENWWYNFDKIMVKIIPTTIQRADQVIVDHAVHRAIVNVTVPWSVNYAASR
jgi:hypothetical protein